MHDALALPMPHSQRTIILIEPSPTIRAIMEQTAQQAGCSSVCSYAVPKPALADLCQGKIAFPALVLVSEKQNDSTLDGWSMLASFAQWHLPLRTILVLEDDQVMAHVKARLAGACASIARPFRVQQLLHLIEVFGRVDPDTSQ